MLETFSMNDLQTDSSLINEGDLYKIINLQGCEFKIYYGYYEEIEKNNPTIEPMPIYPDFKETPQYTDDGFYFVTKMQDACKFYKGSPSMFKECAECQFFKEGDDLIGICICEENKNKQTELD